MLTAELGLSDLTLTDTLGEILQTVAPTPNEPLGTFLWRIKKTLEGTLVQPGGAGTGVRDWRTGAAGVGGGGCTRGAAAAARLGDEAGRDDC